MSTIDLGALQEALIRFADEIAKRTDLTDIETHLRVPRTAGGTLRGSAAGRDLWDSAAGRAVVDAILADEDLAVYHRPPPEFAAFELYGRVATLLARSQASAKSDAFSASNVAQLVEELRNDPTGVGIWLVRGLRLPDGPVAVNPGLLVAEVDDASLRNLSSDHFGPDLVTAPIDIDGALVAQSTVSRQDWLVGADAMAHGFSEVILMELATAVWLAAGVRPVPVTRSWEQSATFPSARPFTEKTAVETRGSSLPDSPPDVLETERLQAAFYRIYMHPWMDEEKDFSPETAEALRAASVLVENALQVTDGALATLESYAAADGLLSNRGDGERITIRRIAALIGSDVKARREVRKGVHALYDMRSAVAHGQRPEWQHVFRFLRRDPVDPDEMTEVETMKIRADLRWQVLRFLRSVYGCFLWLTIDVVEIGEAGGFRMDAQPRLTRDEVINLATDACQGSESAQQQIDAVTPQWLRDPFRAAEHDYKPG